MQLFYYYVVITGFISLEKQGYGGSTGDISREEENKLTIFRGCFTCGGIL
jgi:hypothetical protein